ncbi:hypothetical protein D3C73_627490 [compost metagenome]
MGIGAANAAHLVQDDRDAGLCDLPGCFGAGKAAADHVNGGIGCLCHGPRHYHDKLPTGIKKHFIRSQFGA